MDRPGREGEEMKRSWTFYALLWAVICIPSAGIAQNPPPPPAGQFPILQQFRIMDAGPMMESKVVMGAPYSAETETEIRQTLSDGNHIDHKMTAQIYRDSEGRIRRERTLSILGPMAAERKMVTIFDPVAHVTYLLDSARKIAYKMPARKGMRDMGGGPEVKIRAMTRMDGGVTATAMGMAGGQVAMSMPGGNFMYYRREGVESEPQSVSLGTRMVDGVAADGTRTTTVIPAGKIGNEKPITIVSERWYSPKLLIYLMTRRDDPRFGVITYQLTNLKLGEPPADLFKVPAGYTIKQGPRPRPFRFRTNPPQGGGPASPQP